MDYFNFCRFCMDKNVEEIARIYITEEHKLQFKLLTNIELRDGDPQFYPNYACSTCLEKLHSSVSIKKSFVENQVYLENLYYESSQQLADIFVPEVYVKKEFISESICIKEEYEDTSHLMEEELPDESHIILQNEVIEELKVPRSKRGRPCRNYSCVDCGETFVKKTLFTNHMKIHLKTNDQKESSGKLKKEKTKTKKSNLGSKDEKSVDRRMKEKCNICHIECKKIYLKAHIESVHKKIVNYICDVCGRGYYYKFKLVPHLKNHFNIRDQKCEICGKSYVTSTDLKLHFEVKHKGRQRHMYKSNCEQCGKIFQSNMLLNTHRRTHHGGERIFKCNFEGCNKNYFGRELLKQHETTFHKGINRRIRECPICHKIVKSNLAIHIASVHTERKFTCEFEENGKICGRKYANIEALKKHSAISHYGLRSYPCDFCDNAYSKKMDLDNHRNVVHLKIKIKCELCPTLVTKKDYYRRHVLLHHTELDETTKNALLEKIKRTPKEKLFNTQLSSVEKE